MPRKVKLLSLVLIFTLLDFNFVMKESYTQALHYFPIITLHIETTSLADGTYEFIQEPDGNISEAQANILELTEVPNSDSEELKPTNSINTTEGKPRCIILLF